MDSIPLPTKILENLVFLTVTKESFGDDETNAQNHS
jgi:hypothetical protein